LLESLTEVQTAVQRNFVSVPLSTNVSNEAFSETFFVLWNVITAAL